MAVDWSELLPELVIEIAKNLTLVADQISFANVCSSWQSVVSTFENFFVSPLQLPYLLLAEKKKKLSDDSTTAAEEEEEDMREVFVLTPDEKENGKIYKILLPEAANKRCMSSQGWLLTVSVSEEDDFASVDAALLHPLTRRQIQLPKLDTFPRYEYHDPGYGHMLTKMVLSSDPLFTDDFFVLVIWGCNDQVGFCRPGFTSWINLPSEVFCGVFDITYHNGNGRMYTVDWSGEIFSCHIRDNESRIILQGGDLNGVFQTHAKVPVEIQGVEVESVTNRLMYLLAGYDDDDDKLLVVVRVGRKDILTDYNAEENKTTGFQVFEINLKDNNKWVKVESLRDRALFLGYNTSIFIEADGCIVKPNCIYFTEDFYERYARYAYKEEGGGGTDMGIYHLSDGTIEPHFKGESLGVVSPPLWVVPSF